jgi:demethylmenaquinone methyltransferase/2-methoxy-6-polyprenyl-1,4-benzoquinol methylase
MFDRIAPRYDLMNQLMTGWQDERWRRLSARSVVGEGCDCALDVATGSGALARALWRAGAARVIGVDISSQMLERAALAIEPEAGISLMYADAMALPFPERSFDACTIGFGLRNLPDYQAGLHELARVLAPGGRLGVLELTPLRRPLFGRMFDMYFDWAVPLLGELVTGDREAYRYLPESARAFPDARRLAAMMSQAGLVDIRWRFFGGGTVALHVGAKVGNR